jgi:hypothetical protein
MRVGRRGHYPTLKDSLLMQLSAEFLLLSLQDLVLLEQAIVEKMLLMLSLQSQFSRVAIVSQRQWLRESMGPGRGAGSTTGVVEAAVIVIVLPSTTTAATNHPAQRRRRGWMGECWSVRRKGLLFERSHFINQVCWRLVFDAAS